MNIPHDAGIQLPRGTLSKRLLTLFASLVLDSFSAGRATPRIARLLVLSRSRRSGRPRWLPAEYSLFTMSSHLVAAAPIIRYCHCSGTRSELVLDTNHTLRAQETATTNIA